MNGGGEEKPTDLRIIVYGISEEGEGRKQERGDEKRKKRPERGRGNWGDRVFFGPTKEIVIQANLKGIM